MRNSGTPERLRELQLPELLMICLISFLSVCLHIYIVVVTAGRDPAEVPGGEVHHVRKSGMYSSIQSPGEYFRTSGLLSDFTLLVVLLLVIHFRTYYDDVIIHLFITDYSQSINNVNRLLYVGSDDAY